MYEIDVYYCKNEMQNPQIFAKNLKVLPTPLDATVQQS